VGPVCRRVDAGVGAGAETSMRDGPWARACAMFGHVKGRPGLVIGLPGGPPGRPMGWLGSVVWFALKRAYGVMICLLRCC
jgi:hypothetical protein